MTTTAPYPWQQNQWNYLTTRAHSRQLPHALLLSGTKGLGKLHFAEEFARFVLCKSMMQSEKACGDCSACHLLAANTHPDLHLIDETESGKIKIDVIRELQTWITQSSHQGHYKVVIITPAEGMNKSAANAILKTLEEPTPHTLIMLVSDRPSALLATIRSRSQIVKFPTVGHECAKISTIEREGVSKQDAELLLHLADNAPFCALDWVKNEKLQQRQQVLSELFGSHCDPISLSAKLSDVDLSDLLMWLTACVVDLIRVHFSLQKEFILNHDFFAEINALATRVSIKQLYQLLDRLYLLQQQLRVGINFNRQLLVDSVLCQWFTQGDQSHG